MVKTRSEVTTNVECQFLKLSVFWFILFILLMNVGEFEFTNLLLQPYKLRL